MPQGLNRIRAVSLDFYGTLVYPRHATGRGAALMDYFKTRGLSSGPWEHQVLYDVFGAYGHRYSPRWSAAEQAAFERDLAGHVFRRMGVEVSVSAIAHHSAALWNILGPPAFAVFPDVTATLESLAQAGFRVVVISNWQAGLSGFCEAFGFAPALEHIVASAEVGVAKPEAGIFLETARRLGLEPNEILHVGDTYRDDYEGATAAGLHALLLAREPTANRDDVETIAALGEVRAWLEERNATGLR